jgi:hypothetical protein
MIISRSSKVLSLFLIAAPSYSMPVVESAGVPFETRDELKTALHQYCGGTFDPNVAYGLIEDWDVSKITSMNSIFFGAPGVETCNPDIGIWDVSKVEIFTNMFRGATNFNKNLERWSVGSGKDFNNMFRGATNFNQNVTQWDISSGKYFQNMFQGATSFNQPLLYCNWQSISASFEATDNVCAGTTTCGWGDKDTCNSTKSPSANKSPTFAPTPSPTANTKSTKDSTESTKSSKDSTKSTKIPKSKSHKKRS